MKQLLSILTLLIALFLMQQPVAVYAIEPPSSMSIVSVQVVRNTVFDGDMAIVFHYNIIPFDDYPDEPASDTIIFRLYDPDATTLLASTIPYVFFTNGYGNGVASFYFETAPEWGLQYKLNIVGSPAFFDPLPDPYNYTISSSAYSSSENQTVNQELMASYIISVSRQLELAYPTVTLHGSTDTGIVLSASGEYYFRGAVPGIQSIAPSLFLTQFYVPDPQYMDTSLAQTETYAERLTGTDIMNGFTAIGDEIGIPGDAVAGGGVFICAVGLIVLTSRKGWGVAPGIIAASVLLGLASVVLGGGAMVLRIVLALIAGILIMFLLFFKRS